MVKLRNYLSLIKFSHTIFAMPFALIGFFVAAVPLWGYYFYTAKPDDEYFLFITENSTSFYPRDPSELSVRFLLIISCMIFARSAAMAFNRYLDRQYDAKNPRTASREIPSGIVTPKNAFLFTIINCILFIASSFFINPLCFYLSPVALAVVLGYSYTKRFTVLCHLILGLGLSLAPIGAYIAVTGRFDVLPVIFSVIVLCWVSGFDIIYALQDVEFDRSNRLNSIPAWLGEEKGLRMARILHFFSATLVILAWWYGDFGWIYLAGAGVFIGMLIYQHTLIKPHDLRKVNIAFMTANGIASVVFAIFVIADLFFNQ